MLLLDSASIVEVRRASELGLIGGVTTNPALLARVGDPPEAVIARLADALPGSTVFHQLNAATLDERRAEAERVAAIKIGHPARRVGFKIPASLENFGLAAELKVRHSVGITAIFSPAQVALACQVGAQFVLPYVDRSTRLLGDGLALVRSMRAVIDSLGASTQIIAASIKSPAQASAALVAGAHHLTLPWSVIERMAEHELSAAAIGEFRGFE